ncbi:hypothetical protein PspLS_07993 [Pyricularia sp. CBS 133598]|nr:hypothetical protein PspLS_07993 [Pyricularia sp. CBS 133598]
MSIRTKWNILVCFNPVGTLYKPRPISAADYTGLARKCGISDLEGAKLERALADAIVHFTFDENRSDTDAESQHLLRPGGNPWWRNVVNYAVKRALLPGQGLPADLIPKILALVSPNEGFTLGEPDLQKSFWRLKRTFNPVNSSDNHSFVDKLVVGVAENTRHPRNLERTSSVLSALGISVAPLRYHHYAGLHTNYAAYGETPDELYQSEQRKAAQRALENSVRRHSLRFGGKWSSMIRPYDLDFVCATRNFASGDPTPSLNAAERLTAMMVTNKRPWRLPWAESQIGRRDGDWLKFYVVNNSNKDTRDIIDSGWTPVLLEDNSNAGRTAPGVTPRRPDWESLARLSDAKLDPNSPSGWKLQTYRVSSVDELSRWLSEEMRPKRLVLGQGVVKYGAWKRLGDAPGRKVEHVLKKVLERRHKRRPSRQTMDMSKESVYSLLGRMVKRRLEQDDPDVPAQREQAQEEDAFERLMKASEDSDRKRKRR